MRRGEGEERVRRGNNRERRETERRETERREKREVVSLACAEERTEKSCGVTTERTLPNNLCQLEGV